MSEITILVKTEGSQMSDILEQGKYMMLCAGGSLVSAIFVGCYLLLFLQLFLKTFVRNCLRKFKIFSMEEINNFFNK